MRLRPYRTQTGLRQRLWRRQSSQSSDDTFPTAMHIAAVKAVYEQVLPWLRALQQTFGNWREPTRNNGQTADRQKPESQTPLRGAPEP
jgi:Lyase